MESKNANNANGESGVLGNSKPKPEDEGKVKASAQHLKWCFTYNNYDDNVVKLLKRKAEMHEFKFVIGREVAPTTGTPHLQGYICFKNKKSLECVVNLLGTGYHMIPCKGNEDANVKYCCKEGNWDSNFVKPPIVIETIKESQLMEWQKDIEFMMTYKPSGRTINWYWETTGRTGKSSFTKYMVVKYGKRVAFINGGKLSDVTNIIYENPNLLELEMLIIDLPRGTGNKLSNRAVECILNGMITNTKYETGTKVFNPLHVVVFSNMHPDTSLMSEDRWFIEEITEVLPVTTYVKPVRPRTVV